MMKAYRTQIHKSICIDFIGRMICCILKLYILTFTHYYFAILMTITKLLNIVHCFELRAVK